MKTSLIRIGNSKGIRIPKPILEQCGLEDQIEMVVRDRALIIKPAGGLREGWNEAFGQAAEDEALLPDDASAEWDAAEWRW
jgi:antitoxin MazE